LLDQLYYSLAEENFVLISRTLAVSG